MATISHNIKLITIDLDDTLWPCMPTIKRAEQALYAWMRAYTPAITDEYDMHALREHRIAVMKDRADIAYDLTRVREMSLVELGAKAGYPTALMRRANQYFRHWRNLVTPYPEVEAVLKRLSREYCLVSVTNGNADVAWTALNGLFNYHLSAAEVGSAKPDPEIFYHAAQISNISLDNALHVGDDPLRDIEAARRAGMATVWVNRDGASWPEELPRADHEITALDELAHFL